jgi:hypothetical protein
LDDLVRGDIGGEEESGRGSDEASGKDHRERVMMKPFQVEREKNECLVCVDDGGRCADKSSRRGKRDQRRQSNQ